MPGVIIVRAGSWRFLFKFVGVGRQLSVAALPRNARRGGKRLPVHLALRGNAATERLLSDAELTEDTIENVVRVDSSDDLPERV